ncbi:MAG TPA: hypothetical protein VLT86_02610 [Vicinamibacterales bacterium]|nr:hypothetical protein [Vicinamibacterales bacterium]
MTQRIVSLVAVVLVCATPAIAQTRRAAPPPAKNDSPQVGVRAGVSGDPDQFYFGAHIETSPLIEHLTFRPNAEVGVGDSLTLITFNFEFAYSIPLKNQPWRVYLGAGPALVISAFHSDHPNDGNTDVGGGFNFLVGLQHRKGLFTELKVGVIDSASVKFCVGYVFQ